ncbi:MAG: zinc-ribbon domain containing protein [Patescibacteria group bacterium]|nr:zinc-ribbon domain containing protein [Patescibacteria group bacterium]
MNAQIEAKVVKCVKCGSDFKIVAVEQSFYQKNNLQLPSHCPKCRQEMRAMWRNKRELVKGKCASCGKDIITTPKFSPNVKIYCKDCYNKYSESTDNIRE